jgi:hypothetical protein
MKILNDKFAKHVAASGARFRHVSENYAKHLPYQHPFSSRRHAQDQADGMLGYGTIIASDGYFVANERAAQYAAKNGGALAYPASGTTIAICEWPTQTRIRDVRVFATTAAMDPDSANTAYFPADTAAAFPAFTLQAVDPNDPTFTPIPLMSNQVIAVGSESANIPRISLAALAFGINRRRDPLVIEAVLGGNVVANSGLFVFCEFVSPMP